MEHRNPPAGWFAGWSYDFWATLREFAVGTRRDKTAKPCELLTGGSMSEAQVQPGQTVCAEQISSQSSSKSSSKSSSQGTAEEAGVLDTLTRLQDAFTGSSVLGRRVCSERSAEVRLVLLDACRLQDIIRKPQQVPRALSLIVAVVALGSVPVVLWQRYGWHDQDLTQASNLAQFLEAVASAIFLFSSAFIAVVLLDLRIRTRRAAAEIQRCRVIVQLIDSHVLSNEQIIARLRAPAGAGASNCDHDGVIDYLIYASCLARIAAKTGALYAQWLPRESIVREADQLFQLSMGIERNCLAKVEMMRRMK